MTKAGILPSKNTFIVTLFTLSILLHEVSAAKKCKVDSDCTAQNWAEVCVNLKCEHKKTFPVLPAEVGGIFALLFFKALCTMAGVGGSAIVHPICIVLFGFVTKTAIPIATFATFAATIASFIANYRVKHPEKKGTVLYDYGVICVMMPTTLAGAQIGSFLLIVMPAVIIQICLVLLLVGLMIQCARKGYHHCVRENKIKELRKAAAEKQNAKLPSTTDAGEGIEMREELEIVKYIKKAEDKEVKIELQEIQPAPVSFSKEKEQEQQENGKVVLAQTVAQKLSGDMESLTNPRLEKIEIGKYLFILGEDTQTDKELRTLISCLKQENTHLQFSKQIIAFLVMLALVLLNLAVPTKSRPSPIGMKLCSVGYWALQIGFIVFCGLAALLSIYIVKKEQNLKIKYGNVGMTDSDIIFTTKNVIILVSLGFFGGFLAGAFGLGGGVIYNPILLTMGLPPTVAGACSLFLVCYSKVASTVVYSLNGLMNWPYALWVGLWSCVGGLIGSILLIFYIKYGGRQSFVVWALVLEFLISIVIIPLYGGIQAKAATAQGANIWASTPVC